ncbi:FGGY family carbohydrate kinase [Arthrobacter sp. GMC3]|uniref:FGGY family carbohydrate kinase n=1 Tax=Arthrobacter sp. GMC3 TaxID=2058894 RepID=UPI001CA5C6AB|nr:FGGY family carbohydrate kinase [Arthrobacter sp. GMC3]
MQGRTSIILGIDAGTTSVKTVAFTLSGQIAGIARSSVHIERADTGAAEADMSHIWDAAASTITAVVDQLVDCDVLAIGLTGQGDGAWFVDSRGLPLRRAALWLDARAENRLERWTADGRAAAVHEITGSPLFPGALPLLFEEIAAAEPAVNAALDHQLNCKDWLRYKLTGRIATDPSEASRTYLDTSTGAYSEELLSALGQSGLRSKLPEVLDPQAIAGILEVRVARQLGLPAGIPVAVGMVDTAAAGVGLGAIESGEGYAILGTTGFVGVLHASRQDVRTSSSIVLSTGRGSQVLECLAPMTGTPNLDWARESLGLGDLPWHEVESKARSVPAGSGGLVYLPYGSPSGERAPFTDGSASASWLGMSITTTPAQLLRSVYEGLAYSLTECLDALGLTEDLAICGGGSDSDLLCSILADVSGRCVVRQDEPEVGARGVASLAAVAAGIHPDLRAAVTAMVPKSSTFHPTTSNLAVYRNGYQTFLSTRDALRPHWPQLRSLRTLSKNPPSEMPVATAFPTP